MTKKILEGFDPNEKSERLAAPIGVCLYPKDKQLYKELKAEFGPKVSEMVRETVVELLHGLKEIAKKRAS